MDDNRRMVYSSEDNWTAPDLEKRKKQPAQTQRSVPDDGVIRVARERRRGSMMSIITGLDAAELAETAKVLKRLCGTGGTAKNGVVEIQGDHRDKIVSFFEAKGRRVKKAGG